MPTLFQTNRTTLQLTLAKASRVPAATRFDCWMGERQHLTKRLHTAIQHVVEQLIKLKLLIKSFHLNSKNIFSSKTNYIFQMSFCLFEVMRISAIPNQDIKLLIFPVPMSFQYIICLVCRSVSLYKNFNINHK